MSNALALYVIQTPYPEFDGSMLEVPNLEFTAAWDANALWEAIYLTEDTPLLRKIWRPQPTMIHPTHVRDLAQEIRHLSAHVSKLDAGTRVELVSAAALCDDAASGGHWLISVGP